MKSKALIQILSNESTGTFHPIYFYDSPFPGPHDSDVNSSLIRFKSQGHHTAGLKTKEEAFKKVYQLKEELERQGLTCFADTKDFVLWNGEESPASVVMRARSDLDSLIEKPQIVMAINENEEYFETGILGLKGIRNKITGELRFDA